MIRYIRRALPPLVPLVLTMCSGLDNFDVEETQRTLIPGATVFQTLAGDLGFDNFGDVRVAQSEELANQGVTENQIDSVKLTSLRLTSISPSSQDFTYLDSLSFYIEAEGLARRLVASGADFAAGATTIGLDVEDLELKPYVIKPSVKITAEAEGHAPPQDTTVEAALVLDVDVDVKGALCGS